MKHRSVISFVFVVAALFSLPQLSHDLQALKGAAGARLHRELLHAFLNLPAGDAVAAVRAERPAGTMLASCPQQEKSRARSVKVERVEGRGRSVEQSAMINDPAYSPIGHMARVELKEAADRFVATLPEVKVETEVAMIVPPETGIVPPKDASAFASNDAARAKADGPRFKADGLRVAYATAAGFQSNNAEWQKATEEAFRKLDGPLSGTYEFRFVRDGVETKVLKLKCGRCPANAPRVTRLPRQVALNMPLPAPVAPAEWVSE